jgi:alpha-N-arabinofuranosidase
MRVKVGAEPSAKPISGLLFGKFCEHLGANIYGGMEAQILFNPTFGRWQFAQEDPASGGVCLDPRPETVRKRTEQLVGQRGWSDARRIEEAFHNGLGYGWIPIGNIERLRFSSDAGAQGRVQRVEVRDLEANQTAGIGQETYLPLHRIRKYEFCMVARAIAPIELSLSIAKADAPGLPLVSANLSLGRERHVYTGRLEIPTDAPREAVYLIAAEAKSSAHFIIERLLLYPVDHLDGADPEIVRLLRESGLTLLRWPGGNFVSGYRWEHGIGPVDQRPTVPNPAWDGLEFNSFGTAEFISYCRRVGCEPLICVNAGNGTPEAAAGWVEYCNGAADTPMGRLRSEHGFPSPFEVHYWEVGNEIFGRWQVSWTTPAGNADRYRRFSRAMRAVDPSIRLIATGAQLEGADSEWNQTLIAECAEPELCFSDHPLIGLSVGPDDDPLELFHFHAAAPTFLGRIYQELRSYLRDRGVPGARVALTELQTFSHFRGPREGESPTSEPRMTPETMPGQDTITEALYWASTLFEAIRLDGFVELITHSATVNHGGGLRKRRERVWCNPVHYAHGMLSCLAGARRLAIEINAPQLIARCTIGKPSGELGEVSAVDAIAAAADASGILLAFVHRSATLGPIEVDVSLDGFSARSPAQVITLSGSTVHARNTLESPENVAPRVSTLAFSGAELRDTLAPISLTLVKLELAAQRATGATAAPKR